MPKASILPSYEVYSHPDYDLDLLTVPLIKEALLHSNVRFRSNDRRADVIDLFETHVRQERKVRQPSLGAVSNLYESRSRQASLVPEENVLQQSIEQTPQRRIATPVSITRSTRAQGRVSTPTKEPSPRNEDYFSDSEEDEAKSLKPTFCENSKRIADIRRSESGRSPRKSLRGADLEDVLGELQLLARRREEDSSRIAELTAQLQDMGVDGRR